MLHNLFQLSKFGLVGLLNTILTYLIYLCLAKSMYPTIAMAVGYGITSLIGLALNRQWVFNNQSNRTLTIKYYLTYGLTWGISVLSTHFMSNLLAIPNFIIPILVVTITTPINFILCKYWVFYHHDIKEGLPREK
jgi:putative flippase GtrA